MTIHSMQPKRRKLLRLPGQFALAGVGFPMVSRVLAAPRSNARSLAFDHTHTRERIGLVYAVGDQYVDPALARLNLFLRDHYSGDIGVIDPALFDLLYQIQAALGVDRSFQVISGYRSPITNERLRSKSSGGVAKRSLHIDIRLSGVALVDLRDAARSLKLGGVGYYPHDQFVHVDTGRVRNWG